MEPFLLGEEKTKMWNPVKLLKKDIPREVRIECIDVTVQIKFHDVDMAKKEKFEAQISLNSRGEITPKEELNHANRHKWTFHVRATGGTAWVDYKDLNTNCADIMFLDLTKSDTYTLNFPKCDKKISTPPVRPPKKDGTQTGNG